MIFLDNPKLWQGHADNLYDLQDWLARTPRKWPIVRGSQSNAASAHWDLGVGWEGALALARDGWSEGAKDLSDKLAVNVPALDSEPKWRYDVAGERPDIGRYLAGDPANMMRHGHPKGHKPVLTIAVSGGFSGNTNAREVANYGAALVSMVDQLEAVGRRVEVLSSWITSIDARRLVVTWTVKHAEDSVDLGALAFSLAHPAAFRRLGFAVAERSTLDQTSSYGQPGHLREGDIIDPAPGTLLIPGLATTRGRCTTLEGAMKLAAEQINASAGETLLEVN